jgi:hypothetical protein
MDDATQLQQQRRYDRVARGVQDVAVCCPACRKVLATWNFNGERWGIGEWTNAAPEPFSAEYEAAGGRFMAAHDGGLSFTFECRNRRCGWRGRRREDKLTQQMVAARGVGRRKVVLPA